MIIVLYISVQLFIFEHAIRRAVVQVLQHLGGQDAMEVERRDHGDGCPNDAPHQIKEVPERSVINEMGSTFNNIIITDPGFETYFVPSTFGAWAPRKCVSNQDFLRHFEKGERC